MTTDIGQIEFRPPPPITAKAVNKIESYWTGVAEILLDRPGEWAFVGRHPSSQVSRIRAGKMTAFRPESDWEVVGRKVDEHGRIDVYMRFVAGGTVGES